MNTIGSLKHYIENHQSSVQSVHCIFLYVEVNECINLGHNYSFIVNAV